MLLYRERRIPNASQQSAYAAGFCWAGCLTAWMGCCAIAGVRVRVRFRGGCVSSEAYISAVHAAQIATRRRSDTRGSSQQSPSHTTVYHPTARQTTDLGHRGGGIRISNRSELTACYTRIQANTTCTTCTSSAHQMPGGYEPEITTATPPTLGMQCVYILSDERRSAECIRLAALGARQRFD